MLAQFLTELFAGRPVQVGALASPGRGELHEALPLLREWEQQQRIALPGQPRECQSLAFDAAAALWGATSLYLAAALTIHREAGPDVIDNLLAAPPPDLTQPSAHYAVDLTFRFLPDLVRLAKSAASDDPLVARLLEWGRAWPLSSVGMAPGGAVDATPLRTSPLLVRLYVDRILAAGDESRLDVDFVQRAVAVAIGAHPSLVPQLGIKVPPEQNFAQARQSSQLLL